MSGWWNGINYMPNEVHTKTAQRLRDETEASFDVYWLKWMADVDTGLADLPPSLRTAAREMTTLARETALAAYMAGWKAAFLMLTQ